MDTLQEAVDLTLETRETCARVSRLHKSLLTRAQQLEGEQHRLHTDLAPLQKSQLESARRSSRRHRRLVSEECALFLASVTLLAADSRSRLRHLSSTVRERLVRHAELHVDAQTRAALTSSDIPLPAQYSKEIVTLIWQFGQARKYCTVYPLGAGTVKLPRLVTSPAFGFMNSSGAVPEKSPQMEFVTFAPQKAGGIIRIPAELDEDSLAPLGQFLAEYIAREMARWEDAVAFTADGTSTYSSLVGAGKAAVNLGKVVTLTSGNTAPSNIALADLRALRSLVSDAAHAGAAYYLHPSMEALLYSFNTAATVLPFSASPKGMKASQSFAASHNGILPYQPASPHGPLLDNFPVRWVAAMPVYDTNAHASQIQALFGDLSYNYLGLREELSVNYSLDVYFSTDELGLRVLERFTVAQMDNNAQSALQLAAS